MLRWSVYFILRNRVYNNRKFNMTFRLLIFSSVIMLFDWSNSLWSFRNIASQLLILVEQERLTLPEHLSSPPGLSGVRVTRFLVLYVCFVDRCLSFCTFYFGHCVVCSSSIYGFWLPLWYLQILLVNPTRHAYAPPSPCAHTTIIKNKELQLKSI
jgi:hypothetical protein